MKLSDESRLENGTGRERPFLIRRRRIKELGAMRWRIMEEGILEMEDIYIKLDPLVVYFILPGHIVYQTNP